MSVDQGGASARALHRYAMRILDDAEAERRAGRGEVSTFMRRMAAHFEFMAAHLSVGTEPTHSVLTRSAEAILAGVSRG